MKRSVVFVIFILLIACLLSGCGQKRMDGISDRAFDLGCAVLETTDEYLAGKITVEEAEDALYMPSLLLDGDSCDGENDIIISSAVSNLKAALYFKRIGTATNSDVEEKRDILAGYLGKK